MNGRARVGVGIDERQFDALELSLGDAATAVVPAPSFF
jgi:hypothetical protein